MQLCCLMLQLKFELFNPDAIDHVFEYFYVVVPEPKHLTLSCFFCHSLGEIQSQKQLMQPLMYVHRFF